MKSNIVITHQGLSVGRRYEIVVNGRLVGMMSTPQARFTLPRGAYFLTIRSGRYLPIGKKGKTLDFTVSTSTTFLSEDNTYTHITFSRSWLWWIYRIFKRKSYYDVTVTNTQEAPAVVRPRKTWLQRYMEKHQDEIQARQEAMWKQHQERALERQRRAYQRQLRREERKKRKTEKWKPIIW